MKHVVVRNIAVTNTAFCWQVFKAFVSIEADMYAHHTTTPLSADADFPGYGLY